ncbi:hypothetical protein D3C71_2122680 [compost metagenome]
MVMMRSFQLSIVLALIMEGTAQAMLPIIGTTDFPLRPNFLMILSIRKVTLAIYPVSSRIEMKAKRIAI